MASTSPTPPSPGTGAAVTAMAASGPAPDPHLERSSLYVIVNTGVTGALGAAFWLVAARLSTDADVGAAVAAASVLIGAAFLCQLNLPTAVSRFLPGAAEPGRLLAQAYGAVLAASVVAAGAVVAVGAARGGSVVDGGDGALTVVLALSIPVWVVFALQDQVLVTLRESKWVPIENATTTVAKYGLLPLLTGLGGAGILLAWTAPALVGVVAVTFFLLRRVLPERRRTVLAAEVSTVAGVATRTMVSYALRDFPGAALQMLSLRIVPVLVLEVGDPVDAAYVGLPWTILTVAVLVLPMLSRTLLSELAHDASAEADLMARATRLVLWGMVPATVVGAALVGPFLSLAGGEYADRGTVILAAGALGLGPAAYVEVRLAQLRFHHRVTQSSLFQGLQAVALLVVVVTLVLVDRSGALGVAFVVTNVVAAVAVRPYVARCTRDGVRAPSAPDPLR